MTTFSKPTPEPFQTITTFYPETDILHHQNDVQPLGFPKTKTLGEMIACAREHECNIITKNGKNGKWYIKGNGRTLEFLKNKLDQNIGKMRKGVFCLLLEFRDLPERSSEHNQVSPPNLAPTTAPISSIPNHERWSLGVN